MKTCGFKGEAMSLIKIIILILAPLIVFSQDMNEIKRGDLDLKSFQLMSDEDLKKYWLQAQEKGYSLDEIKLMAKAQGASELEIFQFEKRIGNLELPLSSEVEESEKEDEINTIFGLSPSYDMTNINMNSKNIGVFGSSFFNNPKISPAPSLNIATPDSYELGPGDELSISIWGAAESEYKSKITREGYLKIERVGPVYLSGLSISDAKIKLKNKLSKIYSGINSNYNKVFFDLTLLNSRSIVINIAGSVLAPGTYTLSSLTSPLIAIYAAGGPNDNGSFREIKIMRSGQEVHSIDLYDYLVRGTLESFSLRDQDVILVPTYKKRIFLNGEFKTNGIFELKENESISDLLTFNGGISSSGIKNSLFVERVDGYFKRIETVDRSLFKDFILNDGDIVEARKVGDEIKNSVTVEGAIMIPGKYELDNNTDIKSLIKSAGGLKESALKERAYLIREINGFEQEAKTIDLKASLSSNKTYKLRNRDRLIVPSLEELTSSESVSIRGEVNEPDSYPYFKGMTVVDLILMAKGFNNKGSKEGITIYRSTYDINQKKPVQTLKIDLNENYENISSSQNLQLNANDLIIVRSKLGYQEKEYVTVSGLVNNPGDYAIKTNKYSVYDLINDFEGFLPDAELSGVKIKRDLNKESLNEYIKAIEGDSIIAPVEIDEKIEIALNIEKILNSKGSINSFNLVLKDGDEIIVPKFDNSIEVNGEVQKPTALSYVKGIKTISAINKAGGFGANAKKNKVYVVYQNGDIGSTKSFLFFKNYPKLLPGSKIIVPRKPASTSKTSVSEIVGYTTSLVSIIALIKSL